jgi:hypothetical protein
VQLPVGGAVEQLVPTWNAPRTWPQAVWSALASVVFAPALVPVNERRWTVSNAPGAGGAWSVRTISMALTSGFSTSWTKPMVTCPETGAVRSKAFIVPVWSPASDTMS